MQNLIVIFGFTDSAGSPRSRIEMLLKKGKNDLDFCEYLAAWERLGKVFWWLDGEPFQKLLWILIEIFKIFKVNSTKSRFLEFLSECFGFR